MNIEARLASLEKSNRRLRAGLVLLTLVSVAAFHFGAAADVQDVVRVHKLEVVNAAGQVRATVGADDQGGHVGLVNRLGVKCAALDADGVGGSLLVGEDQPDKSHVLIMADDATGGMISATRAASSRVTIHTSPMLTPYIETEFEGKSVWKSTVYKTPMNH